MQANGRAVDVGAVTGFVYRRIVERVQYPATIEAFEAAGFNPAFWREEYTPFWASIIANPSGHGERAMLTAYRQYLNAMRPQVDEEGHVVRLADPEAMEAARDAYYQQLAWRVTAWGFADEQIGEDGEPRIVPVPAPAEHPDNWQAFLLLPPHLCQWLTEVIRTIHLPKRTLSPPATPTGTTTPTTTPPDPTPHPN